MHKLYEPFVRQGNPIIFMDVRSAELTKYAANSFLATKITFMNEIANLCELLGADVDMVRKGVGTDARIGKRFLFAGIGYGGSCFPKDVQALAKSSSEVSYDFKILNSVMEVKSPAKVKTSGTPRGLFSMVVWRVKQLQFGDCLLNPIPMIFGEAPSLENIKALLARGAIVRAYDPEAMPNVKQVLGDEVYYGVDEYDAAKGADALMIMTEWPIFRTPEFGKLSAALANKVIFDGRNLYDLEDIATEGFDYISIGRKAIKA